MPAGSGGGCPGIKITLQRIGLQGAEWKGAFPSVFGKVILSQLIQDCQRRSLDGWKKLSPILQLFSNWPIFRDAEMCVDVMKHIEKYGFLSFCKSGKYAVLKIQVLFPAQTGIRYKSTGSGFFYALKKPVFSNYSPIEKVRPFQAGLIGCRNRIIWMQLSAPGWLQSCLPFHH